MAQLLNKLHEGKPQDSGASWDTFEEFALYRKAQ